MKIFSKKSVLTVFAGASLFALGCQIPGVAGTDTGSATEKTKGGATQLADGLDVDGDGTVDVQKEEVAEGAIHLLMKDTMEVVSITDDQIITRSDEGGCVEGEWVSDMQNDTSSWVISDGKIEVTSPADCQIQIYNGNSDDIRGLWYTTTFETKVIDSPECADQMIDGEAPFGGMKNAYMSVNVGDEQAIMTVEGDLCFAEQMAAGMQDGTMSGDTSAPGVTVEGCNKVTTEIAGISMVIEINADADQPTMTATLDSCTSTQNIDLSMDKHNCSNEGPSDPMADPEFQTCMQHVIMEQMLKGDGDQTVDPSVLMKKAVAALR